VDGAGSYVYTTELRPRGLGELARRAVALAHEAAPDPDRTLPDLAQAPTGQELEIFDPSLAEASPERKIEILQRAEREGREADPRVRGTEVARYADAFGTVALANSRGFAASYQRSSTSLVLVAIARDDGEALTGYGYSVGRGLDSLDPAAAGRRAARRATTALGGRPVETQRASV